ncbi:FYN-binding protein 1 isoform X3 [Amphiprion ocellaris]|uniref:FYN-binding protein 1 isoform X3 n=1 Tax=Amphiprion ocellaris TaxID=80972 RepID=UPI002411157F|nr:FYN-binding protein 1 isoform X3 [Amphiprion ocellaris]
MEEEGAINFKALRAKFQEEALLAQSQISRPAVAEKPKHIPPPGGHCSSVVSSINIAVENKTPVVPRVIFRDGLRASGGKRPISFPPQPLQTSVSSQLTNGDNTARQSLKDRSMPLVLPVLPVKDQKTEVPAKKEHKLESEQGKEVLPQTKIKKKGLLLPFKSTKTSKVSAENGEEPTYADLTNRPCSAPGELPSVEKQTTEDEVSPYSDQSAAEHPFSSPDIPVTPPSADTSGDSDNKIMSTLERAKKKFSRQQMLISAKPKSLRSPDYTSRDKTFPSPPKNIDSELPIPPPVCLPHLACISARPFFKANSSAHKPALGKQLLRDKNEHSLAKTVEPPFVPLKKHLPDLRTLGSMPAKPPKPPLVDLSRYRALTVREVSPGLSQAPTEEPASEHPVISNPLLDAPEFPEFENSEMETAGDPYADNHPTEEQQNKWVRNPWGNVSGEHAHSAHNHIHSKVPQSPNAVDHKEQRKREKQRLEKEKKEQKEREKKENEMKKKFKVTGEEEPMYHAKVMVASKVRKNDLPVKSGDTVSIIRTTNCPKGKWLARDANHKYGYISVMNVELNIKEMLELGKKAQAAGRGSSADADTISIGSRSSNHPVLTSSFTDDSEEWACEDETLSPSNESHSFPQQTASAPEMSCARVDAQHTLSDANLEDLHTQTRHEALQKLAIFFQHSKDEFGNVSDNGAATPTNAEPPDFLCVVEEPPYPEQEVDFTELELLPPPPLYADT